jgi:hypothetical protein
MQVNRRARRAKTDRATADLDSFCARRRPKSTVGAEESLRRGRTKESAKARKKEPTSGLTVPPHGPSGRARGGSAEGPPRPHWEREPLTRRGDRPGPTRSAPAATARTLQLLCGPRICRSGRPQSSGRCLVRRLRPAASSRSPVERRHPPAELGDVSGKRVLHLQCHIGRDTLCLVRRGAVVTGLDFSSVSIISAGVFRGTPTPVQEVIS